MIQDIRHLLTKLVRFKSITPDDAGCQELMIEYLKALGFRCERYDQAPVKNFYAEYGSQGPLLIFAGHTDVVPVGDESLWTGNPFELREQHGMLYGRGVADMKGSLVSMLLAAKQFVEKYPQPNGRLGFLITSAEEGDHYALGTPHVMQQLKQLGNIPQYCIVGEPSSTKNIGDTIKIGRRGSLNGALIVYGQQGHVAYPHLAKNPIHLISPAMSELVQTHWDLGNQHFPPTSFQITSIQSGGYATNITPSDLTMHFNFRYNTEHSASSLQNRFEHVLKQHGLDYDVRWTLSGEPFLTEKGALLESCLKAISAHTPQKTECSTSGGTSDGRFIAPYGVEVIELGPVNATIHQVNESVKISDLETLTQLYGAVMENLLT